MKEITNETFNAWKRKVQKLMKENGHSLTYAKNELSDMFIYPNADKASHPIKVVFRPSSRMSYLQFQSKKMFTAKSVDGTKTEAMSIFITEVKKFTNDYFLNDSMKIEVVFDKWQVNADNLKENTEWLLEHGFARTGDQEAYYDLKTYAFQLKLVELNKELDEVSPILEFKRKYSSHSQIHFNGKPKEGIEIELRGEVDRRIWVQVVYEDREYLIKFESAHHKKEIMSKDISSNILAVEWDQFKKEEAFKIIYDGPKMNKNIYDWLNALTKRIDHKNHTKTQVVFERFLETMEFEEMVLVAEDFRKNAIVELRNVDIIDSKKDDMYMMSRSDNIFKAKILLFWGKYIVATRMKKYDSEDAECREEEEFHILEDENEAVTLMKKWLLENSFD